MKEEFLHYVWKNRLFRQPLKLVSGGEVEVLDVGQHNTDAGPDFFNAKIRIEGTIWAGNVEIHVQASDWIAHGHDRDQNYQNIILHAVGVNDMDIRAAGNAVIPTAELKFLPGILDNYIQLMHNRDWILCGSSISQVDPMVLNLWLDRLLIERLEHKSNQIRKNLLETKGDWRETIYRQTARSFGFSINSLPFELLTRSLPYKYLSRHFYDPGAVEALLFGQAGFLDGESGDPYYRTMRKEYLFLKQKYSLKPISGQLWKMLRLRPANFPFLRIAQFASFVRHMPDVFQQIPHFHLEWLVECIQSLQPTDYWLTHYQFNKPTAERKKSMSRQSAHNIVINGMVPLVYEYGRQTGSADYRQNAISILEALPPETNKTLSGWKNLGLIIPNAFHSQSLLQLKNCYCNLKKCLYCQIGNQILR
jgi:hypothetical protein